MVKCSCCIPCSCYHIISYLGAVLILVGILIAALQTTIIDIGLKGELQLVPGTTAYDLWEKPDPEKAPLYLSVWIWNINNAEDYTFKPSTGIRDPASWTFPKASVSQIGPFVYLEQYYKTDIMYFDENGDFQNDTSKSNRKNLINVQANQRYSYKSVYDPNDASTGLDPDSTIVNVSNLLTIALPNILEYIFSTMPDIDNKSKLVLRSLINGVLEDAQTLPVLKGITAQQALFDYEDPVLKELKERCLNSNLCKDTPLANLPDKFGFLLEKATKLGWPFYEQDTGVNDINTYGFIKRFKTKESDKYSDKLDFWDLPGTCNDIKGTDGSSVQPHLKKDSINVFSPDVFRTIYGNFSDVVKSKYYGIDTYEFRTLEEVFASPVVNPINSCFCDPTFFDEKPTDINCTETGGGIIPFKANSGIPLLVSLPHFIYGEQFYNYVNGDFSQNEEEFSSKFYFEPVSGSIVSAKKRLQQSLVVTQDKNYPMLDNMPQTTLIMPLVWINESVSISEELEKELYDGVVVGTNLILGLWIGCISLGAVLLIVGCCIKKKSNK